MVIVSVDGQKTLETDKLRESLIPNRVAVVAAQS